MTTAHQHPLLGKDARLVILISGVLAGAVVGFLHIVDYELGGDTERELLSPQLFLYGPAAAVVGFVSAAVHYAWFARARPGGVHWWRHVCATASAFGLAYAGYTLLWLTTPATYLGWFSEPLGAGIVAATVEFVVYRLIRESRNVERRPLRSTSQ
ncbi:hypothetical protein [Leifsonia sp. EB34]|uniref:hypothetical protein n=1 Tax=Leifsonia sp. EB34 TaxID=3156303 RepID=UPI0035157F17